MIIFTLIGGITFVIVFASLIDFSKDVIKYRKAFRHLYTLLLQIRIGCQNGHVQTILDEAIELTKKEAEK